MLNNELYAIKPEAAIKSPRARFFPKHEDYMNLEPGSEAPGYTNDGILDSNKVSVKPPA